MRQLADEVSKRGASCDSSYVSHLETGTRLGNVRLRTASAFGAALSCNPAYLLGLTDDPVPVRTKRR